VSAQLDPATQQEFDRALELAHEGQYADAQRILEGILRANPEHARTYTELGLVYGFTGMFDESIEMLKKGAELNPSDLDARNKLALTFVMLGMESEAKSEFQAVLAIDPNNAVAIKNLSFFE
jgi:tetratricopeptide (TPR) repeat protein